jgi:hypothetical protein
MRGKRSIVPTLHIFVNDGMLRIGGGGGAAVLAERLSSLFCQGFVVVEFNGFAGTGAEPFAINAHRTSLSDVGYQTTDFRFQWQTIAVKAEPIIIPDPDPFSSMTGRGTSATNWNQI